MKKTSTIIWRALHAMKKYVKIKGHSRVFGGAQRSGIFNACSGRVPFVKQPYVEDPRLQPSGMTTSFGFTLVELLIAVLIIGVLIAVGLPYYQHAVYKSKYATLMLPTSSIAKGNEAYYFENGEYSNDVATLAVSDRQDSNANVTVKADENYAFTIGSRDDIQANYIVYQHHSHYYPDNIHCEAFKDDEKAEWLCAKALQGEYISGSQTPGYKTYILEGNKEDGTFLKQCTGTAQQVIDCPTGCGTVVAQGVCNQETGEWDLSGADTSSCVAQPTYTFKAGMLGANPSRNATGTISVGNWTCIDDQWQLDSFSSTVTVTGVNATCSGLYGSDGAPNGGGCTGTYTYGGQCNAGGKSYSCSNSSFSGSTRSNRTYCYAGGAQYGCADSTFDGVYTECFDNVGNGCAGATFTNGAVCMSQTADGCNGAIIKSGSACVVTSSSRGTACDAVYEEGSCCYNDSAGYASCPANAPICASKPTYAY